VHPRLNRLISQRQKLLCQAPKVVLKKSLKEIHQKALFRVEYRAVVIKSMMTLWKKI
jgi:hypothetical protein